MAKASAKSEDQSESIAGYFRPILEERRDLLKGRSNKELFDMWLADHPGETEVPKRVINSLANVKSALRKKYKIKSKRSGQGRASGDAAPAAGPAPAKAPRAARVSLETLEVKIDDCMSLARGMDPERLEEVIRLLRAARNRVVQMSGGQ